MKSRAEVAEDRAETYEKKAKALDADIKVQCTLPDLEDAHFGKPRGMARTIHDNLKTANLTSRLEPG